MVTNMAKARQSPFAQKGRRKALGAFGHRACLLVDLPLNRPNGHSSALWATGELARVAAVSTVASDIPGRSKRHDRRHANSCDSWRPVPAGPWLNVPTRDTVYSAAVNAAEGEVIPEKSSGMASATDFSTGREMFDKRQRLGRDPAGAGPIGADVAPVPVGTPRRRDIGTGRRWWPHRLGYWPPLDNWGCRGGGGTSADGNDC